ncbi:cystatin-A-like [Saccostrea echinata]|uniref:cystatin-A-like n=1 Tax=Saccostrea echinata TaxID=191078 RepID=UPI002A8292C3|nr:cystatin-A-like [Saccostrea echinata]
MVEVLQRDIKRKLPNGYYAGKPLPQFDAISFRTQVDFGMNYFIKVKTAPEMYIHVKIHRDRSHVARVRGVQVDKTLTEPIQAF